MFRDIGRRVRTLREAHGLTQPELAAAAGRLTRSSIANLERGGQAVPLPQLVRIAERLSTTLAVLVGEAPMPDALPAVVILAQFGVFCDEHREVGMFDSRAEAERARAAHRQQHVTPPSESSER